MNYKCLLSLALLASSACMVNAGTRVKPVLTQDDTSDLVLYMSLGAIHPADKFVSEVVSRGRKICVKRMACRHTPDSLRAIRVDLPGLGNVELLNADEAAEVLYHVWQTLGSQNPYEVGGRVLVREKLLGVVRSALQNLGECPVSAEYREHWAVHHGVEEALRYALDQVVDQVVRRLPSRA